jgi:hypothetical protein
MSKRPVPYRLRPGSENADFRAFIGRMKQRLDTLELTYTEFGRLLSCDHAAVSGWMALKYTPKLAYVMQMPAILGCNGHWLLTGEGAMTVEGDAEPLDSGFYRGADLVINDVEDALTQIKDHWTRQAKRHLRAHGETRRDEGDAERLVALADESGGIAPPSQPIPHARGPLRRPS